MIPSVPKSYHQFSSLRCLAREAQKLAPPSVSNPHVYVIEERGWVRKITRHLSKRQMKFHWWWLGPYSIHSVNDNGSYRLEELDGSIPQGTFQWR